MSTFISVIYYILLLGGLLVFAIILWDSNEFSKPINIFMKFYIFYMIFSVIISSFSNIRVTNNLNLKVSKENCMLGIICASGYQKEITTYRITHKRKLNISDAIINSSFLPGKVFAFVVKEVVIESVKAGIVSMVTPIAIALAVVYVLIVVPIIGWIVLLILSPFIIGILVAIFGFITAFFMTITFISLFWEIARYIYLPFLYLF